MAATTREATEATLLGFLAAFKAHNVKAIADLVSPDCVVDSMVGAGLSGRDGIRQLYTEWFQGFPDMAVHTEETLIEGDRAVVFLAVAGTDTGGFMGLPPTDRSFRLTGAFIITVADGLIVRYRSLYDFTGLLVQVDDPFLPDIFFEPGLDALPVELGDDDGAHQLGHPLHDERDARSRPP
jgi:steroid delta-isomerase-like uncharacterized protein